MTVRFTPVSPDPEDMGQDRENLAEIIDIRSKIVTETFSKKVLQTSNETAEVIRSEFGQKPVETEAKAEPEIDTYLVATKKLARKAMSSGELKKELQQMECDSAEIEEVIEEFKKSLYLDDLGLARIICEKQRSNKKASKTQIKQTLQKRLIEQHTIEEVLSELDDEEEHELLYAAAEKRAGQMRDLPRDVAKRRLLGFLARRGWSGSAVTKVVNEVLNS